MLRVSDWPQPSFTSNNQIPIDGTLKVFATTAFLFAFLYAGGSVNTLTYELSTYIRSGLLFASIAISLTIFARKPFLSRKATIMVFIISIFSIIHFPIDPATPIFRKSISYSACAILLSYLTSTTQFSERIKIYNLTIALVIIYFCFLVLSSSVYFDGFIPVIFFSYIPNLEMELLYSQGVSKIFSIGVVAVVFKLLKETSSLFYKASLFFIAFAFLFCLLQEAGGVKSWFASSH